MGEDDMSHRRWLTDESCPLAHCWLQVRLEAAVLALVLLLFTFSCWTQWCRRAGSYSDEWAFPRNLLMMPNSFDFIQCEIGFFFFIDYAFIHSREKKKQLNLDDFFKKKKEGNKFTRNSQEYLKSWLDKWAMGRPVRDTLVGCTKYQDCGPLCEPVEGNCFLGRQVVVNTCTKRMGKSG